jgi:hypothetical protein
VISTRAPQSCQNGALPILSSIGEQRKVGWMGTTDILFFFQKFPGEKRKCETVHVVKQQPVFYNAKVREEIFAHFLAVAVQRHSSTRNRLCRLSERIPCDVILDVKENDEHALTLLFGLSVHGLCFLPQNACPITGRVSVVLFFLEIFKNFLCAFAVWSITKSHEARYTNANKRT